MKHEGFSCIIAFMLSAKCTSLAATFATAKPQDAENVTALEFSGQRVARRSSLGLGLVVADQGQTLVMIRAFSWDNGQERGGSTSIRKMLKVLAWVPAP
jgi:hypothetical protein